jgi:carbonic anhydrase
MQTRAFAVGVLLLAAFAARASESAPHWGYGEHGADAWGDVPGAAACRTGRAQSPIDIRDAKKSALPPLDLHYRKTNASMVDNGHTVQVDLADGGFIAVAGVPYKLVQFHFHTPSEERVDGQSFPMVVHLVHQAADGKLAVVAVLLREGKADAALAPVFESLPHAKGVKKSLHGTFDATALLPADKTYFKYVGSLTTPPCSEGVLWHVLKQPVAVSKAQIAGFRKLYPMNARPVQPLNDRVVEQS